MTTLCIDNNGLKEIYTLNHYAKLGDISIMQKIGGSVILCSICVDYENPSNEDFLPLTIQYIEKMYAIGKIPQGFARKEGKASDIEILTSRLIDRSLRPLFPKHFNYPTQISIIVLSYDGASDIYKDALNLAGITLFCSSIPTICNSVACGVRLARNNKEISCAKNLNSLLDSNLDLFISGYERDGISNITMIEMQALKTMVDNIESSNEITKEELLDSIKFARDEILKLSSIYKDAFKPYINTKFSLPNMAIDTELINDIKSRFSSDIKAALMADSKNERKIHYKKLFDNIKSQYEVDIESSLACIKKDIMRNMVLDEKVRADGRSARQIRPIHIESNLLPQTHGSVCFTRGETQALVTCTLGSQNDIKNDEGLYQKKRKVIFHYNFPPFCVGEAMPITASSRREIGHGNLALKAIESNIKDKTQPLRIVSEILQSNGSSSMASVCGATLALKCANVEMQNMVAGIAMGLIYKSESEYTILSDIMGLEDHDGDMDFKIAGNELGFSALQLDIKMESISDSILLDSFTQAQDGLIEILNIMRAVDIKPNFDILPKKLSFNIPPQKVAEVIGQGGKTIREIIAKFKISIDFDKESGLVTLSSTAQSNMEMLEEAREYILEMLKRREKREFAYQVGSIYDGVVKKLLDYGVSVEMPQGGYGLVRLDSNDMQFELGCAVQVRVIAHNNGRLELEIMESKNV